MDVTGGSLNYSINFEYSQILKGAKQILAALGDVNAAMSAFGKIDEWADITKESINAQKQYIKELEKQYEQLGLVIENLSEGSKKDAARSRYEAIGKELEAEKQSLLDMEDAIKANQLANSSLQNQYNRVVDEMQKLAAAGAKDTAEYDALAKKAEELKAAMNGVNNELKPQNAALQTMASGITTITGAMSAAAGVVGLFGEKNERLNELMTKMQSLMAITIGLQQVSTNLSKQGNLMLGIEAVQRAAAGKAAVLQAKGTAAATVAQKAFNIVAKANPYVLLATAIITVVGAIALFTKGTKEAKKNEEELQRVTEESAKRQKEFNQSVADSAASLIASYTSLRLQWNKLSSEQEKNKWVKDNKSEFEKLGIAVNSVADAENVMINNSDAVIQSFILRAKAAAYASIAVDKYKEAIELELKGQEELRKKGAVKAGQKITSEKFQNDFFGVLNDNGEWVFSEEGAKRKNETTSGVLGFFKSEEASKLVEQEQSLLAEANKILKDAGIDAVNNTKETHKGLIDENERYLEELRKATERAEDLENANLEETTENKKKKIRDKYNREIAEAEENARKAKQPELAKQYERQAEALRSAMLKAIDEVDNEEKRKQQELLDELLDKYATYERKKKAISEQYLSDITKLEEQRDKATSNEERLRYEQAIAEAQKKQKEELVGLTLEYGTIARLNEQVANKEMEKLLAVDSGDIETVKKLDEEIYRLKKQIKDIEDNADEKSLGQMFKEWADDLKSSELISAGGELGNVIANIGEAADNKAVAGFGQALSFAGNIGAKIASGDYLGAALSVITSIGNAIAEDIAKVMAFDKANEQAAQSANQIRINNLLTGENGIFGEDSVRQVANYLEAMDKAKKAIGDLGVNVNKSFKVLDRSAFSNFFGGADKFSSLGDFARKNGMELYDAYGNVNADLLDLFKNTYEDLTEADRQWIDNAIAYTDQYAEAMEGLASYLETIFGNTVDTIVDQLFEGAVDMKAIVSDVGETMAKDLMRSAIMASYFGDLKDQMTKILKAEGGMSDKAAAEIFGIYTEAMAKFEHDLPSWQALAEQYQEAFDFGEASSIGAGMALASASQESIDLLNGQLNAMRTVQGRIDGTINSILLEMRGFRGDINTNHGETLQQLQQINSNTSATGLGRSLGAYFG